MPRRSWQSFRIEPEMLVGHVDHRLDPRLLHAFDPVGIGEVGRVVDLDPLGGLLLRMAELDVVDHARARS